MASVIYENFYTSRYIHLKSGVTSTKDRFGKYSANNAYYKDHGRLPPAEETLYGVKPDLVDLRSSDFADRPPSTRLVNKLYGKLREEIVGPKGELLTSAVEWKTSLDMISGRVRTLGSAFLAIKKFQFRKAAKILRISTPSKFKNLSKAQAKSQKLLPTNVWLEYWMGWAPMCGDVAHAMNTLTTGPAESSRHFRVGVAEEWTYQYGYETYYYGRLETKWVRSFRYKMQYSAYGEVLVTNHNKNLANQLGLTNPALTAWQILPFSFMIDWFANIGTVIGSLTDFENLTFRNTGTASKLTVDATMTGRWLAMRYDPNNQPVFLEINTSGFRDISKRSPGSLPSPRFNIQALNRLSLTRAATSVSLLVEIFLRKK